MNNLIDQISINKDIVYNPDSAYDLLYQHFSSGAINNLTDTELERLLLKLRLKIGFMLESSAKHNHTNFLQFILNLSVNSCLDSLKISQGLYGDLIIIAAQNSNLEILRFLIKLISEPDQFDSINVNIKFNKMGIAHKNQIKSFIQIGKFVLELLEHLSENKNLNIDEDKAYNYIKDNYIDTALYFAAHIGHKEILEYIFYFTPDPEIRYKLLHNPTNFNPIVITANEGPIDNLKFLFGLLKDNKERLSTILKNKKKILKTAAFAGNIEKFKYLVSFIPDKYINKILFLENDDIHRNTINSGNIEFIKYLMEITPNSLLEKKILDTINYLKFNHQDSMEILKYLLSFITNDTVIYNYISYGDYDKFRHATEIGRIDIVKYFLELASSHNIIQDMILTGGKLNAVNFAIKHGHLDILKLLVELVSDRSKIIDIILNGGLYRSVIYGHIDIVIFLIYFLPDHKTIKKIIAPKNITSYFFNINLISCAAINGHVDIFKYLIQVYHENASSQELMKKYIEKNLKYVVLNGQTNTLKFFLEFDTDKKLFNKVFSEKIYILDNPFSMAFKLKHLNIVKYITELSTEHNNTYKLLKKEINSIFFWEYYGHPRMKYKDENSLELLYYFLKISDQKRLLKNYIFCEDIMLKTAQFGRNDILESMLELFAKDSKACLFYRGIANIISREGPSGDSVFRAAAKNEKIEVLKNFIDNIPEKLRSKMIHSENGDAFRIALISGYDIIDLLFELTKDSNERNNMIYYASNSFKYAAEEGNLDSLKLIVEIAPIHISKMLKDESFYAFRNASKFGHVQILKYLIDLSEDSVIDEKPKTKNLLNKLVDKTKIIMNSGPSNITKNDKENSLLLDSEKLKYLDLENFKENMIHANNDESFRSAASNSHIGSMNYLLTLEQDPESKKKMIHSNNNQVFKEAIKNNNIDIVEFLLGSFLNQESNSKIIYPELEEAIINKNLVKYLGDIDSSVDWSFLNFA